MQSTDLSQDPSWAVPFPVPHYGQVWRFSCQVLQSPSVPPPLLLWPPSLGPPLLLLPQPLPQLLAWTLRKRPHKFWKVCTQCEHLSPKRPFKFEMTERSVPTARLQIMYIHLRVCHYSVPGQTWNPFWLQNTFTSCNSCFQLPSWQCTIFRR